MAQLFIENPLSQMIFKISPNFDKFFAGTNPNALKYTENPVHLAPFFNNCYQGIFMIEKNREKLILILLSLVGHLFPCIFIFKCIYDDLSTKYIEFCTDIQIFFAQSWHTDSFQKGFILFSIKLKKITFYRLDDELNRQFDAKCDIILTISTDLSCG